MSFEFLYITRDIARSNFVIGQGVDFIFVDMEYIGKAERQPGDTVKNRHTPDDISQIAEFCNPKKLLARINPYGAYSQDEIESAISAGATHIMLPMINSREAVIGAASAIKGRAALVPLIETIYSLKNLEQIIKDGHPEFVFFGLNDLYREMNLGFMFEVLALNLLDHPANICKKYGTKFGFGGVSKFDNGTLNSKLILNEHARLGSSYVILSRDFARNVSDEDFSTELSKIREYVSEAKSSDFLLESSFTLKFRVREILESQ